MHTSLKINKSLKNKTNIMKKKTLIILKNNSSGRAYASKINRGTHYHGKRVILMAVVLPVHKVTGTIDYPRKIADRKARAEEISTKSATSNWLTLDPAFTTAFNLTRTDYAGATTANRPGMFTKMNNYTQKIMGIFQEAADNDPSNSIAILESGGFHTMDATGGKVKEFGAKNGKASGSADLITAGGPPKKRHLHQWYSSVDGVIFVREQATNDRKTTLLGYEVGKYMYFMVELSVQDELQGLSQIIKLMIN
jgi:hypothetical protein